MGEINSVVTPESLITNPAVMPWIGSKELSLQHLLYVSDVSYSMLTYAHPLSKAKALSVSAGYLGVDKLTRTVADASNINGYTEQGSFAYSDMLVSLGYGAKLSNVFSWGINLKAVQETIDTNTTAAPMVSLGGFYHPIKEGNWNVSFGVFNIGPQVGNFDLPLGGFIGIGKEVYPQLFWGGDVVTYIDQMTELKTGFEYSFSDVFFLRGGYRYSLRDPDLGDLPLVDLTGGVGLRLNRLSLDYAWVPYGDLGTSHRLTLSLKIGEPLYKEVKESRRFPKKKNVIQW